ncbi:MAG TPA: protein-tyrosine phosphatase family protein [Acidimicrobiales bacterium]
MRDRTAHPVAHWAERRSLHGGVDEIPLPRGVGGRLWLCGKRFIAPNPERAMAYVDADAAVCLNEPHELEWYPEYVEWLKAQPSERVIWRPIPDLHVPSRDDAVELLAEVRSRLDGGQSLLMHCGAGIGRTGTIAAGVLITMGESPAHAIARLRAHRSLCGPEAGAQTELLDWLFACHPGENIVDVE